MTPDERAARIFDRIHTSSSSGCWEYTGARDPNGYGRVRTPRGETSLVHRWLYQYMRGSVANALTLDHLCRNPCCCNPDHLEPVSQGENTLRGDTIATSAAAKTECDHGHPFDENNTWRNPRNGVRQCRACNARRQRETKLRRANRRSLTLT